MKQYNRRAAQGVCATVLFLSIVPLAHGQLAADRIRLNQVGFYPERPKIAAVVDASAGSFSVVRAASGEPAFTGTLGEDRTWSWSGESVRLADFSGLTEEGLYYLDVPGVGHSYPFRIAANAHQEVARGSLKALYFQRVSTALAPEYAGAWARPAGHADDQVEVHPSAATDSRPAGTLIAAPGGWYDAGDYNKYIVPASFTSYVMLAGLEHYPAYFEKLETDVPESGNGVPDVLDEAIWNLRFMLDMQDPDDGGLYHKLSTANFQGTVAPHVPTATRYVVQKSTAATLDFAAAAAQASRVLRDYESAYPGLADSLLSAALGAWGWAQRNPSVGYNQSQINQAYDPDINTGEYGDSNRSDELAWAAIELYVTTGQDSFHQVVDVFQNNSVPGWGSVNMLGYMTLVRLALPTAAGADLRAEAEQRLLSVADQYRAHYENSPMGTAIGLSQGNFGWGSNGGAGAIGMVLVQAYALTGDETYLDAGISTLDYLLGLNGTGYSFLTAYGMRPPVSPHHRPSQSDDVAMPVPGLLAGGPNPGQQDNCTYDSDLPASSYVDDYCSYASNEITTYWNVPLLYVAAAAEHLAGSAPGGAAPPHLLAPMPRAEGLPIFAPLSWSATEPFDAYQVQASTSPLFDPPLVDEILETERTVVMLEAGSTVYWRVRGFTRDEPGRWSTMGVFSVGGDGPVSAFAEDGGLVVIEAENRTGQLSQPGGEWVFWRPVGGDVDRSAYGGPNTDRSFGDSFRVESPMLYYNLKFNTPGTWYPWVRMFSTSSADDEIHLGINGVPLTTDNPLRAGEPHDAWHWVNSTASGQRAAIEIDASGLYVLNLWMAEDGVLVDRLLLSNDPAYEPMGEGPPESAIAVGAESAPLSRRGTLALQHVYPFPVRDQAEIIFSIPSTAMVRLELFDALGRRVAVLLEKALPAGTHQHNINLEFASGSYFLRLSAGGTSVTRSLIVLR